MLKENHIVILGAGFAGLAAAQQLGDTSARVTIVDRQNHHLFQPLLYQVATCGLSAPEISQPVRSIFARFSNIRTIMSEVRSIELHARQVRLDTEVLDYDFLIVALGSGTSYFGHSEWEPHAPGLKNLGDALLIRSKLLQSFEQAENEKDIEERRRLMTMSVVGAGPTGVELAGAFAELGRTVLLKDFRSIDPRETRVVLIEAADRIFPALPAELSEKALVQLKALGVEVLTNTRVLNVTDDALELSDGQALRAATKVWAAGVRAHPIGAQLGAAQDRAGRVAVGKDLSLPEHPEVFVIGDMALVLTDKGAPVPGVAPAAMQMGAFVGRMLKQPEAPRPIFRYWDKGTMATIGRSAAVAMIGNIKFGGFLAWLAWMFVHLLFLVGFRNRLAVFLQWIYSYFIYKRGARLILSKPSQAFEPPPAKPISPA